MTVDKYLKWNVKDSEEVKLIKLIFYRSYARVYLNKDNKYLPMHNISKKEMYRAMYDIHKLVGNYLEENYKNAKEES